jgi:alginate O-acetyltransferase complex protein AlgI
MLFNSLDFIVFLSTTLILYRICPQKVRWVILLAGSIVFYAFLGRIYLLVALLAIVLVTYSLGRFVEQAKAEKHKKILLLTGILFNLLVFLVLRYANYLQTSVGLMGGIFPHLINNNRSIISIGMSFIAFQAISYLVDIWLGKCSSEKHLGYFALYICFFPKLLQGPIERAAGLIPQLRADYHFDYNNVRSGLILICWGLVKKMVIADRVSVFVNQVFQNVRSYTGVSLIIATYAYAIQIYADFSGYTDIALGVSRFFNISLTDNFNNPYFSENVATFWRRWHISFMSWLTDYIFRPLQMKWRYWGILGSFCALLVVFGISGLWHGVGWTYLIWGAINGVYMICGVIFGAIKKRIAKSGKNRKIAPQRILDVLFVFNLISFSWIFFRADNTEDAVYVITHLMRGIGDQLRSLGAFESAISVGFSKSGIYLAAGLVVAYLFAEVVIYMSGVKFDEMVIVKYRRIRWPIYLTLITVIVVFSYLQSQQFIYFKY